MKPSLKSVTLPDFGMPDAEPRVGASTYRARLAKARERMAESGFDRLIVYADREHSANLAYLTGFAPQFEEALLILGGGEDPALLAGNECYGLAQAAPVALRCRLFQDFSLPGQPRATSESLEDILVAEGIGPAARVGLAGWKVFDDPATIEAPAYIVDTLRRLIGLHGRLENAGSIFMNAADGLRVINEVEQLAAFEFAACQTSGGIRQLLAGLRPGMSEREAARLLGWSGQPLSCHLMLVSGERAPLGLVSPGDRIIQRGDPFTVAFGTWGALNCRAGFVVDDETQLPEPIRNYVERLVAPYFDAVASWYSTLRVGITGGELFASVADRLSDPFFGVFLNPGHQIHLDEWVNSPVHANSAIELKSGMALQCDIIPATGTAYFTTNLEDGVALGDDDLRAELADRFPDAWTRIQHRRDFMRDALGIALDPSVLPFSNIPACLAPFLLRPDRVMTMN